MTRAHGVCRVAMSSQMAAPTRASVDSLLERNALQALRLQLQLDRDEAAACSSFLSPQRPTDPDVLK